MSRDLLEQIERLAVECARESLAMADVPGPWGDGDMQPGDLDALAELVGADPSYEQLRTFEAAFRRAYGEG